MHLKTFINRFKIDGQALLGEDKYSFFNSEEIYKNYVDSFFEKYSFRREFTNNDFNNGGYLFYSYNKIRVYFIQLEGSNFLRCEIDDGNGIISIQDIASEYDMLIEKYTNIATRKNILKSLSCTYQLLKSF